MAGFGSDSRRYLCSHLVTLRWDDQTRLMNLEEISRDFALLESDEAVPCGVLAEMSAGNARFIGSVTHVEQHEFGWKVDFRFSPLTPWTIENFQPQHMLDPARLT